MASDVSASRLHRAQTAARFGCERCVMRGCFLLETPAVRASDDSGGRIHAGLGRYGCAGNASPHTRFRISVECRVVSNGSNSVSGVEGVEDLRFDPPPRCHVVAVLDCPVPHCLQLLFRAT